MAYADNNKADKNKFMFFIFIIDINKRIFFILRKPKFFTTGIPKYAEDMKKKTFWPVMVLFSLLMVSSSAEAYKEWVKICGLMPNVEVLVKLSDDTVIRKAVTNKNGDVLIEKLHGEYFIFESTSADGKPFRFEVIISPESGITKSGVLQIDCYKLF